MVFSLNFRSLQQWPRVRAPATRCTFDVSNRLGLQAASRLRNGWRLPERQYYLLIARLHPRDDVPWKDRARRATEALRWFRLGELARLLAARLGEPTSLVERCDRQILVLV